ncbi:MAG: carboxypeptidase-like regulatory domain-containing protein [Planctomycetota bacterium]
MKDLEQVLQGGRDLPTPSHLSDKLKSAVDSSVGATASTVGAATNSSVSAWVAGTITVVVAAALTYFLYSDETPAELPSETAGVSGEVVATGTAEETADGLPNADLVDANGGAGTVTTTSTITSTHMPHFHGTVTDDAGVPLVDTRVVLQLRDSHSDRVLAAIDVFTDEAGQYRCTQSELLQAALNDLAQATEDSADEPDEQVEISGVDHFVHAPVVRQVSEALTFEVTSDDRPMSYRAVTLAGPPGSLRERLQAALAKAAQKQTEKTEETTIETAAGQHLLVSRQRDATVGAVDAEAIQTEAIDLATIEYLAVNEARKDALTWTSRGQQLPDASREWSNDVEQRRAVMAELRDRELALRENAEKLDRRRLPAPRRAQNEARATEMAAEVAALEAQRAMLEEEIAVSTLWSTQPPSSFRVTLTALADGFRGAERQHFVTGSETLASDFTLEPGHVLRGFVLDSARHPVPNAVVEVIASPGDANLPRAARRVTSSSEGSFRFSSLGAAVNILQAIAPGWQGTQHVARSGPQPTVIEMSRGITVTVELADASGAAAVGYEVELSRGDQVIGETRTNASGVANLTELAPGDYMLRVYRQGPFPAIEESLAVWSTDHMHRSYQLRADVEGVAGEIVIPASDEARPQLMVVAYHLDSAPSSERKVTARVNQDGQFQLGRMPAGRYVFGVASLRGGSWGHRCFHNVTLTAGDGPEQVSLAYAEVPHGTLRVTALDELQLPIRGARVTMTRARTRLSATRNTSRDGVLELALHPDKFDVTVAAPGYQPFEFQVTLGSEAIADHRCTLVRNEDAQAAAVQVFGDQGVVASGAELTVLAVFEMAREHAPGSLSLDGSTAQQQSLAQLTIQPREQSTLAAWIAAALEEHTLSWQTDATTIVVGP